MLPKGQGHECHLFQFSGISLHEEFHLEGSQNILFFNLFDIVDAPCTWEICAEVVFLKEISFIDALCQQESGIRKV